MNDQPATVLAEPPWVWPAVWVAFPVLGAGAMWLLKLAAQWVAALPAAPMQWLFTLAAAVPEPGATIAAVVLGLLAGGAVAAYAQQDSLVVTVGPGELRLARGEQTAQLRHADISAVFLDGKDLVVIDRTGGELARYPNDRPAADLGQALAAHGYPWHPDGDPYDDLYRRWVPGVPGLPAGAEALLAARKDALERDDEKDAAALRQELARLGVVVRQDETRQYWRKTTVEGEDD